MLRQLTLDIAHRNYNVSQAAGYWQHKWEEQSMKAKSRRMTQHRLSRLVALVGVVALVAACGSTASSVAPSMAPSASAIAEPIALNVLTASGSHDTFLRAAEEAWNNGEHPFKIKLTITQDSNENVMTSVKLALAGQNPPDFTFMQTGKNPNVGDLAEAGLILDLAPYVQQYGWKDRFDPGMWDQLLWPGDSTYQMAYQGGPLPFVWYNTDLFKQLNLTVPADRRVTEDQLFGYVDGLKAAGLGGLSLGNKDKWPGEHFFRVILLRTAGSEFAEKLQDRGMSNTGADFDDPKVIATLAKIQDWVRRGLWVPGTNAMADGDAISIFAKAEAGMYQAGFWGLDVVPGANPDLKFDYFHYPQLDPSIPVAISSSPSAGYVISSKSKYPDQIAAFLDFMMTKDGQKLALEEAAIFPGTNQLTGVTDLNIKNPLWNDLISDVATTPTSRYCLACTSPAEVNQLGQTLLQSIFDLSLTPEDWGAQMQAIVPG